MMGSRSSRSRNVSGREQPDTHLHDQGGLGDLFSRQRLTIGGLTAFAVAFSYVSANALWYQPHQHTGTFFATRTPDEDGRSQAEDEAAVAQRPDVETVIRLEDEDAQPDPRPDGPAQVPEAAPLPSVAERPSGDTSVRSVQTVLAELKLYDGEIDGLMGPQTRDAIASYRERVGLPSGDTIDTELMRTLGESTEIAAAEDRDATATTASIPVPAPAASEARTQAPSRDEERLRRIQAGLKAFGNDGIEMDGRMGSRTREALLEFQSLFGLEQTGEPDDKVYAKMREIGLTN